MHGCCPWKSDVPAALNIRRAGKKKIGDRGEQGEARF